MTAALAVAAVVGAAAMAELLDAVAAVRARRADRTLLDGGHDVEYAPAAGRLIHYTGCWCRTCEPGGVPRSLQHRPRRPVPTQDRIPLPPGSGESRPR